MTDIEQARWDAARTAAGDLAEAFVSGDVTNETLTGAVAQIAQIPLDMAVVVDSIHVPGDAGVHAGGLERILRRIPDGWGRWIGCSKGWYGLLCDLDDNIALIVPDYEVHQVKEKFGGLRFYVGGGSTTWDCCARFDSEFPKPDVGLRSILASVTDRTGAEQADRDVWLVWVEARDAHEATGEHQENVTATKEKSAAIHALIRSAEQLAASTCEQCADPGGPVINAGWCSTMCPTCATAANATALDDDNDDDDDDDDGLMTGA